MTYLGSNDVSMTFFKNLFGFNLTQFTSMFAPADHLSGYTSNYQSELVPFDNRKKPRCGAFGWIRDRNKDAEHWLY